MKKKIAAVIAALAAILILAGCGTNEVEDKIESYEMPARFVMVEKTYSWRIVYDCETKVMYAVSFGKHNSGNFTLLVDQNGNPLLYDDAHE